MPITIVPMTAADTEDIVSFLISNSFPFHVHATPQAANIRMKIENGRFWNEDTQGYWAVMDEHRIGMVALEDLQEGDSPSSTCPWTMPNTLRFEGQTREDSIATRKTFLRAGFLKEAHYRLGWPTNDGGHVASIAYSILRQDWETGDVTRFDWEDLTI